MARLNLTEIPWRMLRMAVIRGRSKPFGSADIRASHTRLRGRCLHTASMKHLLDQRLIEVADEKGGERTPPELIRAGRPKTQSCPAADPRLYRLTPAGIAASDLGEYELVTRPAAAS